MQPQAYASLVLGTMGRHGTSVSYGGLGFGLVNMGPHLGKALLMVQVSAVEKNAWSLSWFVTCFFDVSTSVEFGMHVPFGAVWQEELRAVAVDLGGCERLRETWSPIQSEDLLFREHD